MRSGKCSVLSLGLGFIFLLLVAIVFFPTDSGAPNAVRKAKCLNNLKQCAQALKMYADDYDGQLPSSYLVSHAKRWNAADSLTFCARIGAFPPGQAPKQTWAQVLYDHIYAPDVAFCPRDPVDRKNPHAWISYWYKAANDKAWYGVGCKKPRRNMSDYGYESDQIAFYERLAWHFGDTSGLKKGLQINASFIDTHVETIVLDDSATTGDPIACAVNSNGEPMYYNTKADSSGYSKKQSGPATLTDPAMCYDTL